MKWNGMLRVVAVCLENCWQSNNLANFNLRLEIMWHLLAGVRVPLLPLLPLHLQRQFKSFFWVSEVPSPPLTLIHIHVRQMANGCTGEMKSVFDFVRVFWLALRDHCGSPLDRRLLWSLSPSPSIIVYDDWVPLWTRIHSTLGLFTTVQCVRLFVVHSSRISRFKFLSLSMRPSATTKCINNRETNFKAVRNTLYFFLYMYILCVYRNMSKSLLPVLFSLWLPHCSALKWDAVASVNIEAICAQCAQWVGTSRVKFYIK